MKIGISYQTTTLTRFCDKSCGTSVAQMTEHSTGNRKDMVSIPSGVEAFLFLQKISSRVTLSKYYKIQRLEQVETVL